MFERQTNKMEQDKTKNNTWDITFYPPNTRGMWINISDIIKRRHLKCYFQSNTNMGNRRKSTVTHHFETIKEYKYAILYQNTIK